MSAKNRTCWVCQQKYAYCPSCSRDYLKPTWMIMFHDENCKDIFETLQSYSVGEITVDEAREILKGLDLSQKNSFRDDSKKVISQILPRKKKAKSKVNSN